MFQIGLLRLYSVLVAGVRHFVVGLLLSSLAQHSTQALRQLDAYSIGFPLPSGYGNVGGVIEVIIAQFIVGHTFR